MPAENYERITMITSYVPDNLFSSIKNDKTDVKLSKTYSNINKLGKQFYNYRIQEILNFIDLNNKKNELYNENFNNYDLNQALNEDQDGLSKALENSKPFVKKKLGQNIKLKKMPELLFFIDQQDNPI